MAPGPVIIDPSQSFLGNDGNWSTFSIGIGSPPQQVNLLPATTGSSVVAIDSQYGCAQAPFYNSSGCQTARGGVFDRARSSSWVNLKYGNFPLTPLQFLPVENATLRIGASSSALAGLDKLRIGTRNDAPSVEGQYVASYIGQAFPWVGTFGLSYYGYNTLDLKVTSVAPPLNSLRNQSVVGSQTYGYTAGAVYKDTPQYGSLVFGGYDSSRGDAANALQVDKSDNLRDLILNIRDINIGTDAATGINQPAFIDSLITQLYLPEAAWKLFESGFGITYNTTVGYYLVDDTTHDRLLRENKSVRMTLSATATSSQTVDITLPYGAFDHSLRFPYAGINDSTTALRYFPIQKANSTAQNILGRVFLQEAYLAVNYDNNTFAVSQAKFPGGSGVAAVCIGCNSDFTTASGSSSSLSGGAIAGIVIGVLLAIAILVGAFFGRRYYQKRKLRKLASELTSRASIGGTTVNETPYNLEPSNNMEYYKPPLPPTDEKAELDAMLAGQRPSTYHRHELAGDHDRRMSSHSGITRATFSPNSPHQGTLSPMTSQPASPPATGQHANGSWYFELPNEPKSKGELKHISELGGSEPRPVGTTSVPVQEGTDQINTRASNTPEPTETTPALADHSDSIPKTAQRPS